MLRTLTRILFCGLLLAPGVRAGGFPVAAKDLWSFQPVHRPAVPAGPAGQISSNPIDCFLLSSLKEQGLSFNPEADRRTLIRRLTLDLHGLPPTPEEIDLFERDASPNAWYTLVERLLSSPRYGEHWARHWLDIVRYTESQGFEYDHLRPNAWHYRDYVIHAFNLDKPYNEFIRDQIAGDALHPDSPESIVATSLLVCGPWDQAGSAQANLTQRAITREEELEDLISTVAQGVLGMTVNCARCHAHKFDPIPQADYYSIKAVFEGVRHGERSIAGASAMQEREREVAKLKEQFADKAELDRALAKLPPVPVSYAGVRQQPGSATHLLKRGDVKSPGEEVRPGGLSGIVGFSGDLGLPSNGPEAERRVRFAEWLVDPKNPLTARVIVNRLWQYHFGQGIVATPSDFGSSGGKPSHRELLDWLASELIERGWSLKAMHRLIVESAAYRQNSTPNSKAGQIDADNSLLWRFKPRRLEAEAIRDSILAASGSMNWQMGGPSFRPFDIVVFNSSSYIPKDVSGPEFDRRTVYRANVNSGKDPLLDSLDCPDPSVKTPRRSVTMTPLQSLSLMNNPFVEREARKLAGRASRESGSTDEALARVYQLVLGRNPDPAERRQARTVIEDRGLWHLCWALFNSTEFLYVQ